MRHTRILAPLLLIALVLSQTACPQVKTSELAGYSREVVATLKDTVVIFESNGIATDKLRTAIDIGNRLTDRFQSGGGVDAIGLTSDLITTFDSVTRDVKVLKDPVVRTTILVGLVVANAALRHISQALPDEAVANGPKRSTREGAQISVIAEFKQRKRWVCRVSGPIGKYKAGQFAPMTICKQFPDKTEVETYYY